MCGACGARSSAWVQVPYEVDGQRAAVQVIWRPAHDTSATAEAGRNTGPRGRRRALTVHDRPVSRQVTEHMRSSHPNPRGSQAWRSVAIPSSAAMYHSIVAMQSSTDATVEGRGGGRTRWSDRYVGGRPGRRMPAPGVRNARRRADQSGRVALAVPATYRPPRGAAPAPAGRRSGVRGRRHTMPDPAARSVFITAQPTRPVPS